MCWLFFFFQAEDGIRVLVRSRGLGDVYKRQHLELGRLGIARDEVEDAAHVATDIVGGCEVGQVGVDASRLRVVVAGADVTVGGEPGACLLYTSDAADDLLCVDLGGRRIPKKKQATKTYLLLLLILKI